MRLGMIAAVMALAQCQQVCQVDGIVEYVDPACQIQSDFGKTPEQAQEQLDRLNEMIKNGPQCQYYLPEMEKDPAAAVASKAQEWNETIKAQLTCLSSESLKVEVFNFKNDDQNCERPMPSFSAFPSYVAQTGVCVQTSFMTWIKYSISSTTGKFENTTYSPDITPYPESLPPTEEQLLDESADSRICMIADYQVYNDSKCSIPVTGPDADKDKDYFLYLMNTNLQSPSCDFPRDNEPFGIKARTYCQSTSKAKVNFYNIFNEDPQCYYPYPETIYHENSYVAEDGECTWVDGGYLKFTVLPYDGRSWEWNNEWDGKKFKQETPMSMAMMGMEGMNQTFKFEGEGYAVDMNVDMTNGQKLDYTMKFDKYFMHGIDYMGAEGYGMPPCGPDAPYDQCKEKVYSQDTCCTHVTMGSMIQENAVQSFYRCMNVKVVDAAFSFEIDGMKMSMACTGNGTMSGAKYFSGAAIFASLVALISSATF